MLLNSPQVFYYSILSISIFFSNIQETKLVYNNQGKRKLIFLYAFESTFIIKRSTPP